MTIRSFLRIATLSSRAAKHVVAGSGRAPVRASFKAVLCAGGMALGLALWASAPASAAPAETGTGIGFVLGTPTGFNLKLPQGRAHALQFTLGYDLDGGPHWAGPGDDGGSHFYLGGDYLWYNYEVFRVEQGRLPLYYGPGVWASLHNHGSDSHARAGIRGVIGIAYQFANAPFDVFLELGPGISVVPDTHGHGFGGLGGRFYF